MDEVYWSAPVLVMVLAFVLIVTVPYRRARRQANTDFRRARGTQHRLIVEEALAKVDARIAALRSAITRNQQARAELIAEEQLELDKALARQLVRTRLVEVPGIGKTRAAAIESIVLDQRLTDLHQAAARVPGIGPATQLAISQWVNGMMASWALLREGAFADKQAIQERYKRRATALLQQGQSLEQRGGELEQLTRTARAALISLGSPTPDDFAAVLKNRSSRDHQPVPAHYIVGLFAPWATAPRWFNELLTSAQEGDRVGRAS